MPDDRTTVTELATALGTLAGSTLAAPLGPRPESLRVDETAWRRLRSAYRSGRYGTEFGLAFANGRALLGADDGLRGRQPRLIEWTGGRRPPGDEAAPIDLRIDHVYLVSCKYESDILANTSPARLFDGLLATVGPWERADWYATVAPVELHALYTACRRAVAVDLPTELEACSREQRAALRHALRGRRYPGNAAQTAYRDLCRAVSLASARRWQGQLAAGSASPEHMLWRLLRIGSAPYFLLGIDRRTSDPVRFRVASPWDWRDSYELLDFRVSPASAGQPRVDWRCAYRGRRTPGTREIGGHVEIRWSHGRFAQPPEAKVYLDTPLELVPGYHVLAGDRPVQATLFALP